MRSSLRGDERFDVQYTELLRINDQKRSADPRRVRGVQAVPVHATFLLTSMLTAVTPTERVSRWAQQSRPQGPSLPLLCRATRSAWQPLPDRQAHYRSCRRWRAGVPRDFGRRQPRRPDDGSAHPSRPSQQHRGLPEQLYPLAVVTRFAVSLAFFGILQTCENFPSFKDDILANINLINVVIKPHTLDCSKSTNGSDGASRQLAERARLDLISPEAEASSASPPPSAEPSDKSDDGKSRNVRCPAHSLAPAQPTRSCSTPSDQPLCRSPRDPAAPSTARRTSDADGAVTKVAAWLSSLRGAIDAELPTTRHGKLEKPRSDVDKAAQWTHVNPCSHEYAEWEGPVLSEGAMREKAGQAFETSHDVPLRQSTPHPLVDQKLVMLIPAHIPQSSGWHLTLGSTLDSNFSSLLWWSTKVRSQSVAFAQHSDP